MMTHVRLSVSELSEYPGSSLQALRFHVVLINHHLLGVEWIYDRKCPPGSAATPASILTVLSASWLSPPAAMSSAAPALGKVA